MKIMHVHDVAFVASTIIQATNKIEDVEALLFDRGKFSIKNIFSHVKNIHSFKKFTASVKPDIIHIHYSSTAIYAKLAGLNYVLHVHGSDVRGLYTTSNPRLKTKIRAAITRKLLEDADLVFFSTPDLYKEIEMIRPDAIFIPNPVNRMQIFDEEKRSKVNILFFCALSLSKGADIAFRIFDRVKERYGENVDITCISAGRNTELFLNHESVKYINPVNHNQISSLLKDYDIIIGQLKLDVIGVSELEAMMCKKPVVSNFNYSEFYNMKCPLIDTNDEEELNDHLNQLIISKEKRNELAQEQYLWVTENHDSDVIALKLIEIYRQHYKG